MANEISMPDLKVKPQKPKQRRIAILRAAADEFFEHGYEATSIDAIIERIGGSKRNIYSEFGNKEGLFVALISERADYALMPLGESEGRNLRETLLEFGRRFVTLSTSAAMLGVYRAAVSEAQRFPDLARIFYERGPGRGESRLAELLEAANRKGESQIADCASAASHFIGMLRDNFHLRMLLGLACAPDSKQVEKAVNSAVDIFLFGISGSPQQSKIPPGRANRRLPRHK
jgi:AcrR family transcriptional regulator